LPSLSSDREKGGRVRQGQQQNPYQTSEARNRMKEEAGKRGRRNPPPRCVKRRGERPAGRKARSRKKERFPGKKEKNEEKIKGVRSFPSSLMRLEREGSNCLIGEGKITCSFPAKKRLNACGM